MLSSLALSMKTKHGNVTKAYIYQVLYVTFLVGKNKKLVFKLTFIIVSEAYLTPMVKAQFENKKCN